MRLFGWAAFSVICAMSIGAAVAQTPAAPTAAAKPPPAPTYKSLLDQGFELKDTMFLSSGVSTRLDQAIISDTVLVSLEKGAVTATCWFTLSGWERQQGISGVSCSILQ
jgi:hypothetical protein